MDNYSMNTDVILSLCLKKDKAENVGKESASEKTSMPSECMYMDLEL